MTAHDAAVAAMDSADKGVDTAKPKTSPHAWMLVLSGLGLWGNQLFAFALLFDRSAIMGMSPMGAAVVLLLVCAPAAVISLGLLLLYTVLTKAWRVDNEAPWWMWVPMLGALVTVAEVGIMLTT